MILLISQNEGEISTDLVYDWIRHSGKKVRRVNGDDLLQESTLKIIPTGESILLGDLHFDDISIIWYRRWVQKGNINIYLERQKGKYFSGYDIESVREYLRQEFKGLSHYFFYQLQKKEWLNKPPSLQEYPSKSIQIKEAKKIGFNVPETLITNNKLELINFIEKNGELICKNLERVHLFNKAGKNVCTYTIMLNRTNVEEIQQLFFPTLFQKAIKKIFEVRIFYFLEEFYPMAIFSSNNPQTNVDFRRYDLKKPNRTIPIVISDELKLKIKALMRCFKLETGSIDMIYGEDEKFYF